MKAKIILLAGLCLSLEALAQSGEVTRDFRNRRPGQATNPNNQTSVINNQVRLDHPVYNGTGCEQGTASAVLSDDKKTLSIIFDQYVAEAGKDQGGAPPVTRPPRGNQANARLQRKNCDLVIPFTAPKGLQVAVVQLDYRGYNYLPLGAKSSFLARYYYSFPTSHKPSSSIVSYKKDFLGPLDEEYLMSGETSNDMLWSNCGESFNLHINTLVILQTNARFEEAISSVDSLDLAERNNLDYHLLWRECQENRTPGNGGTNRPPRGGGRIPTYYPYPSLPRP